MRFSRNNICCLHLEELNVYKKRIQTNKWQPKFTPIFVYKQIVAFPSEKEAKSVLKKKKHTINAN